MGWSVSWNALGRILERGPFRDLAGLGRTWPPWTEQTVVALFLSAMTPSPPGTEVGKRSEHFPVGSVLGKGSGPEPKDTQLLTRIEVQLSEHHRHLEQTGSDVVCNNRTGSWVVDALAIISKIQELNRPRSVVDQPVER